MAPVVKKKARRNVPGEYNSDKFVSAAAQERYDKVMLIKPVIPERGFTNPGGRTEHIIYNRDWLYLTTSPSPGCIPLIREFYANAKEHRVFTVFVRGKWIPINKTAINRIYNLEDIDEDEYSIFCSQPINYNMILKFLCKPESNVEWKRKDGKPVNFHSTGLTSESKAWHYFISGKLMPTSNTSEVTKERAVLNYCIQTGLSIDVGAIIHNSLLHIIQGVTTSGLGHPCLIDALCCACGVVGASNEEVCNPKSAITKEKIFSYNSKFNFEVGESSQARTPPPRKSVSLSEQVGRLADSVARMDTSVQTLVKKVERVENKVDHYTDQQMQQAEYMANYNHVMSTVVTNYSLNAGLHNVQFPEPPIFTYYNWQEEEQEEQEEEESE